jgi:hypothetical protein
LPPARARRFAPRSSLNPRGVLDADSVLASFLSLLYRPVISDDSLTPATRGDVETCLSLALTSGRSYARSQAAEVTAKVVAERLVAHLEASGFVIMRKPIRAIGAGDNPGRRSFER